MTSRSSSIGQLLQSVGRNVVAGAIVWIIVLGFVQFGERVLGGWPASEVGQFLACTVGVVVALRLRARLMAYFVAAMAAFSASEVAIHLYYGIRAAQGAPTHFAVMGAGVLGVMLGSLLVPGRGVRPGVGTSHAVADPLILKTGMNSDHSTGTSERRSNTALQPAGARS
jgi:hypothetical protein